MKSVELVSGRVHHGVWQGVLSGGSGMPQLEVRHLDQALPDVLVRATNDGWSIDVPIPKQMINEGSQTFVLFDKMTGKTIGSFSLIAGAPLQHDLQAELDLMRAELDMLKRAFRRHCAETSSDP